MICEQLVTAEKMINAFESMIKDRCVGMCGLNIVNADDLLYLLGLWKGNLKGGEF